MTLPTKARLTLITEAETLLGIDQQRAAGIVDAYFVLLADAVRAGVTPEKPEPLPLSDDDRRAELIRRMEEQKRSVSD